MELCYMDTGNTCFLINYWRWSPVVCVCVNIPKSHLWLLQVNKLVTTSVFHRSHQTFGRKRRVGSNSILRLEVSPPDVAAFLRQSFQTVLLMLSGSLLASELNPKYCRTGTFCFSHFNTKSSVIVLSHLSHRHVSRLCHSCRSALLLCGAHTGRLYMACVTID